MILRQARANLEYSRMMDFIEGDPEAVLVVEVTGDTEAELSAALDRLERRMSLAGLGYTVRRVTASADQARVWAVRKAGLGLMMNVPGDEKPLPFVEDTAVAPERLPGFVRRFDEIIREHGTTAGYYGHASVGCLHIRPLIDLKRQEGVDRLTSISAAISDLVLEYGGSMSGEHGDGLVRSVWNEKMFGSQIYEAFREVKRAFDPKGVMNPGKIVDSPPMTENLRIDPSYRTVSVETGLGYSREGGFARRNRDVQRSGGVPEGARRNDVSFLHGDPGRGALDEGTRQRAESRLVGQASGRVVDRPADVRGDGAVPRVQGRARRSALPTWTSPSSSTSSWTATGGRTGRRSGTRSSAT